MVKNKPTDAMPERAGFRERTRNSILGLIAAYRRVMKPWDSAKCLFNYHLIDGVLEKAVPDADMRLAIEVFILSALITFIMSFVAIIGSAYMANAESQAVQAAIGTVQPTVGVADLYFPTLLALIIYVPVSILVSLALQYCSFRVLRMMGGKAAFAQQLYLSSIVTLAAAFTTVLYIFFPISCLQLLGGICFVAANIYLSIVAAGRAYSIAHRLGPVSGFAVALVVAMLNLVIILLITNAVSGMLGMPQQITNISDILNGA